MNRSGGPLLSRALWRLRQPSRACTAASSPSNVEPPLRIHRTPTSLLEVISATVPCATLHPELMPQDTVLLKGLTARLCTLLHLSKFRGRQSARYFLDNFPDEFSTLNFEAPPIHAFRPRHSVERLMKAEATEETLSRLIGLGAINQAWWVYEAMEKEQISSSSESRLRMLDLLCAFNSRSKALVGTYPIEIFVGRAQPGLQNDAVFKQMVPASWNFKGRAHNLFASLEGWERGPGYRAMIRGLVKYGEYAKALEMHRQMKAEGFRGDRATYTALLRCVHTVEFQRFSEEGKEKTQWPMRAGLDLLYEMRDAGVEPDVETFNALLFSIAFSVLKSSIRPNVAFNCFLSIIKEVEALGMQLNLGTLTNVLRLGFNFNHIRRTTYRQTLQMGETPVMSSEEHRRTYSNMVRYVTDRVAENKGRKYFATEYDLETMFLLRDAKNVMMDNDALMLYVHRALRDSQNLTINGRLSVYYFAGLLERLADQLPLDAIEVFEKEQQNSAGIWENLRTKLRMIYAEHKPERLQSFLEADIHVLTMRWFTLHVSAPFITSVSRVVKKHPHCQPHVVRSFKYLMERIQAESMDSMGSEIVSTILPILLRTDQPELRDSTGLALKLAEFFYSLSAGPVSLEGVLLLGTALLDAGRTADGMAVLQAIVDRKDHVVQDKELKKMCHSMINALVERPEVMADGPLHQRLVQHQSGRSIYRVLAKVPGADEEPNQGRKRRTAKQSAGRERTKENEEDRLKVRSLIQEMRTKKTDANVSSRPRKPWRRGKKQVEKKKDDTSSSSSISSDED